MVNKYNGHGRTLIGIILVVLGGLLFLRNLDFFVWNFNIFSWPVILLVIGIIILSNNKNSGGGLILVVLGIIGLISRYTNFSFRYILHEYWPILLIGFGIYLVLKRNSSDNFKEAESIQNDEYYLDTFSFLKGRTLKIKTNNFLGGKITALLSGFKIDMTEANFVNQKTIDIVTILGGTEIFIPSDKKIIFNATTMFGGFEDKRSKLFSSDTESNDVLMIKGLVLFGGVEIKN